jgi:protein-S-isoprenylcysteine O-methyltransferase Ste14
MGDGANVMVKPPLLFGGALVLGCVLSWLVPLGPELASANGRALATGAAFVLLGLGLVAAAVLEFRRADTSLVPGEPAATLVTSGPYRFTRNPIYIGFVLLYFGLAIMLTSVWMLLLLIPVLIILQLGVVAREEAYLAEEFGTAYRAYQARVPRWL